MTAPWGHWARRFTTSLSRRLPAADDDAWLLEQLEPAEVAWYQRMSPQDRRHAVGCARMAHTLLGAASTREIRVASALHDVGKVQSGLGTVGRSFASAAGTVGALRPRLPARWQQYLDHSEIGALLLQEAGSGPLAVAWAREHHLPPAEWTIDPSVGRALIEADGYSF